MDKKKKAKRINLVEFCKKMGIPLLDENSKNPKLAEHDSLVFFPDSIEGQWYRYSIQQGGDSISFVQQYYNVDFKQAIDLLLDSEAKTITPGQKQKENRVFKYDHESEVNLTDKASNYLVNERMIDQKIVDLFIKLGLIKQDKNNNIVFKWIDDGKIVGVSRQGTLKQKENQRSWKMIDKDSMGSRGFNIKIGTPHTVRFFESSIDLMSYMTLYKDKLKDTWFISMEGLKQSIFEHYAVKALKEIGGNPSFVYCIDNDLKGNEFADKIKKINSPYLTIEQPKHNKDWNDELKEKNKNHSKKKKRSFER